jgi:hypothetical protein
MKRVNWAARRLGFRCMCDRCRATLGPIGKREGKFWQARYGESAKDFKKRYRESHKLKHDPQLAYCPCESCLDPM